MKNSELVDRVWNPGVEMNAPYKWRKPWRVSVELFRDDQTDEFISKCFCQMGSGKKHTFMVLAINPERMKSFLNKCANWGGWMTHDGTAPAKSYGGTGHIVGGSDRWPLPNVWLGVSVENQKTADERIPVLLSTPAAVRWVSFEPALGAVDFTNIDWGVLDAGMKGHTFDALEGGGQHTETPWKLDWIVVGGESGPGARPMHPDIPRSVRDQCLDAGVAFFFKQWGAWVDYKQIGATGWHGLGPSTKSKPWRGTISKGNGMLPATPLFDGKGLITRSVGTDGVLAVKVGKAKAGRDLDGVKWSEYPGVG